MSGFPKGWASIALGDITDPSAPIQYGVLKPGPRTAAGVPMLRVTDIRTNTVNAADIYPISTELDEEFRRTRLRPNDIVISVQGTVGRIAIVPDILDGANISRTLARIRSIIPEFSKWIRIALLSPQMQERISADVGGTTRDSLNIGDLRAIDLPFPPLLEQQRIVAKIDRLMIGSQSASVNIVTAQNLATRLKAEYINNIYREVYNSCNRLRPLGDIAQQIRNGLSKKPSASPPGTRILRISAVRPLAVNISDYRFYPSEEDITDDNLICDGDLLFTRYNGNPDLTGVCGVVKNVVEPTTYPDKIIRVRFPNDICPYFVSIVATSMQSREFLSDRIKSAAGQHGISGKDLKNLPIPLPSYDVQREIALKVEGALSSIGELLMDASSAQKQLQKLDQAILAKAFRGELVPQGSNDEPASVLLERVKANRATAGHTPTRSRRARVAPGA